MSKTIWRYNLNAKLVATEMPEGAKVLSFGCTSAGPCLWAEVDPEAPKGRKVFAIVKTGDPIPEKAGEYVGTLRVVHGSALHLYRMPDDTEILVTGCGCDNEDCGEDG